MAARRRPAEPEGTRRRPARTPQGRESEMVSLAMDLAERQIRDGTASSQVISHFLKLGSSREELEQQKLRHDNELTRVRMEAIEGQKRIEEMYSNALNAMRSYAGQEPLPADDDYDD